MPGFGLLAQTKFAGAAQIAMAAGQIFFERNAIAFLHIPSPRGYGADVVDASDILVAHDARGPVELIRTPIASAHAGRFNLENAGVRRNIGKRILANFRV